jgi:uncharacterized membrane protein
MPAFNYIIISQVELLKHLLNVCHVIRIYVLSFARLLATLSLAENLSFFFLLFFCN